MQILRDKLNISIYKYYYLFKLVVLKIQILLLIPSYIIIHKYNIARNYGYMYNINIFNIGTYYFSTILIK